MLKNREGISWKMRMRIWRAKLSMPGLLSRYDEKKIVSLVTAIHGGIAILTISLLAWLTELPLIFPALGPSTFILFSAPLTTAGAPRNVILGHLLCMAIGYGVWHLVSYLAGGPVSVETGGWPMFVSAALALTLSCLLLVRISCPHPPACASSLVIALGAVTQWTSILLMAVVIIWLTAQAVAMNRLAGLPVPLWSPRSREDL
jgi:CBS domain-containing membrane protein